MIKNRKQYIQAQISRWAFYNSLENLEYASLGIEMAKVYRESILSQIADLEKEIEEYEALLADDPLTGLAAEKRRADQSALNTRWLIDKIDRIHEALCPDQTGTWQQRAEQAVEVAEKRTVWTPLPRE